MISEIIIFLAMWLTTSLCEVSLSVTAYDCDSPDIKTWRYDASQVQACQKAANSPFFQTSIQVRFFCMFEYLSKLSAVVRKQDTAVVPSFVQKQISRSEANHRRGRRLK